MTKNMGLDNMWWHKFGDVKKIVAHVWEDLWLVENYDTDEEELSGIFELISIRELRDGVLGMKRNAVYRND